MSQKKTPEELDAVPPFDRLAMGQMLGKSSILIYDRHADDVQQTLVDMILIEGADLDATEVTLTLHHPRMVKLTDKQTSFEVTPCSVVGTYDPIRSPIEALIEFGTGGVTTKVVVDYVSGAVLSVFASYLRVTALVTQRHHVTRATYYCAAHVGPGLAESHVQRTIFVGDVDEHGESAVFDVPKFGKVATLIGCKRILFWQDPSGGHRVGDFVMADHQSRVEVPNAAQYFSVFDEPGHEMKTAVSFELVVA